MAIKSLFPLKQSYMNVDIHNRPDPEVEVPITRNLDLVQRADLLSKTKNTSKNQ